MDKKLAGEILDAAEGLSKPIALLGERLNRIDNLEEKKQYRRFLGEIMASLEIDIKHSIISTLKDTGLPSGKDEKTKQEKTYDAIISASEHLQDASSELILAIDTVEDEDERKSLRRSYAELIVFIEEKFVFEVNILRKSE